MLITDLTVNVMQAVDNYAAEADPTGRLVVTASEGDRARFVLDLQPEDIIEFEALFLAYRRNALPKRDTPYEPEP